MNNRAFGKLLRRTAALLTEKPVETPHVFLRQFCAEDFDDYFEFTSQKELLRLSGIPGYSDRKKAREAFEKDLPKPRACAPRFAVVYRETGKVIGHFTLSVYPFLLTDPVLSNLRGLCLSFALHEDYQRRGLMTELLREANRRLFEDAKLDYVNCGYFSFNEGSRRLQEKAGMRRYMTHLYEHDGKKTETVEMILFRSQYLPERTTGDPSVP